MRSTRTIAERLRGLRAQAQDARGATAVEFALVATPFFLMICGIIELVMIFMVSVSLENSTSQAARTIRTGEQQTGSAKDAATFKTKICNGMGWLQTDCEAKLRLDVRTFASHSNTNNQGAPITAGAWNSSTPCFQTGGPTDIVLVRAYYEWTLVAPGFSKALEKLNGGKTVISAVSTFRNEPYGATTANAACPA